jgi:RsiW-degrading membrane proteinase PrsW (M82 family)
MPFHESYGGNKYFYSCCLALTFATFNIIVGVVFIAKKRCLNNFLNLFLKFYLILIDLYLIDNAILLYTHRDKTSEIIEHSNILVIVTCCVVGISILISILSIVYHFVVKTNNKKKRLIKK